VRRKQRGKTVLEAMYPAAPEELVRVAKSWVANSSVVMLGAVWSAYDQMRANSALKNSLTLATDDIERGITRLLFFALDDILSGNEPFRLLPEAPEDESRKRPPARPRAYDIGFSMRENPRIIWSLEAKVMPTPATLADYLKTLKQRYLSGDYAPFVGEGAMVAFLLSGTAAEAFKALAEQLGSPLHKSPTWNARDHRFSTHRRQVPRGKPYPVRFRCHHLMMVFA
jgi:hypothetical protein